MRKAVLTAIVLILAAVPLAAIGVIASGASCVVVTNASGQSVDRLTVEVCGRRLIFDGLADNESRIRWHSIDRDSGYAITGSLADGSPINAQYGYVTNGMYLERVEVRILPGGRVEPGQAP